LDSGGRGRSKIAKKQIDARGKMKNLAHLEVKMGRGQTPRAECWNASEGDGEGKILEWEGEGHLAEAKSIARLRLRR